MRCASTLTITLEVRLHSLAHSWLAQWRSTESAPSPWQQRWPPREGGAAEQGFRLQPPSQHCCRLRPEAGGRERGACQRAGSQGSAQAQATSRLERETRGDREVSRSQVPPPPPRACLGFASVTAISVAVAHDAVAHEAGKKLGPDFLARMWNVKPHHLTL